MTDLLDPTWPAAVVDAAPEATPLAGFTGDESIRGMPCLR